MSTVKSYVTEITRPFRWNLVKILSPGIWSRSRAELGAVPRGSTLYAVSYFGDKPISYCEVGVHKGENALDVFQNLNIEQSYLIDMYKAYGIITDEIHSYVSQQVQDDVFKVAKNRLKPVKDKITWILKYSDKAVEDLPNNIDFIYIDGNHEYEFVKKDIELYWEKVSKKGILAGHDFYGRYNGIINAVHEFAMENKLHIYSNLYDWWFIKY